MMAEVLHVINRLHPMAGAEKQVSNLVAKSSLPSRIVEVEAHLDEPTAARLRHLRKAIADHSPAAVVAWLDHSQIATALTAPRSVPLIASLRAPGQRRSRLRQTPLRTAFRRYDGFAANSEALRQATRSFSATTRSRPFAVIPNGVEPAAPQPRPDRGEGPLQIAYVGRVNRWKGADTLVAALRMLPADSAHAVFAGAGSTDLEAALAELNGRCRVLGRVDDPWSAIGAVDVLVIPSRVGSEGSPNVVLEAFARGVPVIGSSDPPVAELLADGRGIVTPAGDVGKLAAAIRHVAEDPEGAQERAERASAYVSEHHAWPAVVARWDEFVTEVARKARA